MRKTDPKATPTPTAAANAHTPSASAAVEEDDDCAPSFIASNPLKTFGQQQQERDLQIRRASREVADPPIGYQKSTARPFHPTGQDSGIAKSASSAFGHGAAMQNSERLAPQNNSNVTLNPSSGSDNENVYCSNSASGTVVDNNNNNPHRLETIGSNDAFSTRNNTDTFSKMSAPSPAASQQSQSLIRPSALQPASPLGEEEADGATAFPPQQSSAPFATNESFGGNRTLGDGTLNYLEPSALRGNLSATVAAEGSAGHPFLVASPSTARGTAPRSPGCTPRRGEGSGGGHLDLTLAANDPSLQGRGAHYDASSPFEATGHGSVSSPMVPLGMIAGGPNASASGSYGRIGNIPVGMAPSDGPDDNGHSGAESEQDPGTARGAKGVAGPLEGRYDDGANASGAPDGDGGEEDSGDAGREGSADSARAAAAAATMRIDVLNYGRNHAREYPTNAICTSKYTVVSFVPLNLFEQFRRISNTYFLLVMILTLIPGASPVNPFSAIIPLALVVGVAAVKDAFEDFRRHRSDAKANSIPAHVLRNGEFIDVPSEDVLVGDVLKIHHGEEVRADCVLLSSSLAEGMAYIETSNLDGETNAKTKRSLDVTFQAIKNADDLVALCNVDVAPELTFSDRFCTSLRTFPSRFAAGCKNLFNTVAEGVGCSKMTEDNSEKIEKRADKEEPSFGPDAHHNTRPVANNTPDGYHGGGGGANPPIVVLAGGSASAAPNNLNSTVNPRTAQQQRHNDGGDVEMQQHVVVSPSVAIGGGGKEASDGAASQLSTNNNSSGDSAASIAEIKRQQMLLPNGEGPGTKYGMRIIAAMPDPNLAYWQGILRMGGPDKSYPLGLDNFLFRGAVLRNTEWALAAVVYSGVETKMFLNLKQKPPKRSQFDKQMNMLILFMFILTIALVVTFASLALVYHLNHEENWYMTPATYDQSNLEIWGWRFITHFILLSYLVPISLFITLEINKGLQVLFISMDGEMADYNADRREWRHCRPKTSNLTSQLGRVKYIFADKTGTLTENRMTFVGGHIDTVVYKTYAEVPFEGPPPAPEGADGEGTDGEGGGTTGRSNDDTTRNRTPATNRNNRLYDNGGVGGDLGSVRHHAGEADEMGSMAASLHYARSNDYAAMGGIDGAGASGGDGGGAHSRNAFRHAAALLNDDEGSGASMTGSRAPVIAVRDNVIGSNALGLELMRCGFRGSKAFAEKRRQEMVNEKMLEALTGAVATPAAHRRNMSMGLALSTNAANSQQVSTRNTHARTATNASALHARALSNQFGGLQSGATPLGEGYGLPPRHSRTNSRVPAGQQQQQQQTDALAAGFAGVGASGETLGGNPQLGGSGASFRNHHQRNRSDLNSLNFPNAISPHARVRSIGGDSAASGMSYGGANGATQTLERSSIFMYLLSLAACHNVVCFAPRPEQLAKLADNAPTRARKIYEGQSLDEVALVQAAADNFFELTDRSSKEMVIEVMGRCYVYDIIAELEFTPQRKLMSIILRRNKAKDAEANRVRKEYLASVAPPPPASKDPMARSQGASMAASRALSPSASIHHNRFPSAQASLGGGRKDKLSGLHRRGDPNNISNISHRPAMSFGAAQQQQQQTPQGEANTDPFAAPFSSGDEQFQAQRTQQPQEGLIDVFHRPAISFDLGPATHSRTPSMAVSQVVHNVHTVGGDPTTAVRIIDEANEDVYPYLMLTKGADSSMMPLVDMSKQVNVDMAPGVETTLQSMATSGLRTLVLGYRRLAQQDVDAFLPALEEANKAMGDRNRMVHDAYALIERQFTLIGATAVEDKLQEGVPETIDFFIRAKVVVWMLTGDKRETAVTIAGTSGIIDPVSTEEVIHIDVTGYPDEEKITAVAEKIRQAKLIIDSQAENTAVLVIDGVSLNAALQVDAKAMGLEPDCNFFDLGSKCRAAVCCRMTPLQKADVVRMFQTTTGHVALAIGDGANDVSMIQEAEIGIGIMGLEGAQAELASDFAIPRFRHLKRLMVVHGRYSVYRDATTVLYSVYKCIVIVIALAIFSGRSAFSGQAAFNSWFLSMYNSFYCQVQALALGIIDKDLPASLLESNPLLYTELSEKSTYFNPREWVLVIGEAGLIGAALSLTALTSLDANDLSREHTNSLADLGSIWFIAIIVVMDTAATLRFLRSWTYVTIGTMIFGYAVLLIFTFALCSITNFGGTSLYGVAEKIFVVFIFYAQILIAVAGFFVCASLLKAYVVDTVVYPATSANMAVERVVNPQRKVIKAQRALEEAQLEAEEQAIQAAAEDALLEARGFNYDDDDEDADGVAMEGDEDHFGEMPNPHEQQAVGPDPATGVLVVPQQQDRETTGSTDPTWSSAVANPSGQQPSPQPTMSPWLSNAASPAAGTRRLPPTSPLVPSESSASPEQQPFTPGMPPAAPIG